MWCVQEKLKCFPVFESHNGEVSRNFMLGTCRVADEVYTVCYERFNFNEH